MAKILFFNSTGTVGGPSKSLYFLLHELKKHPWEISVVVPEKGDLYYKLIEEGISVQVIPIPQLFIPRNVFQLFKGMIQSIYYIFYLIGFILKEKPQIIHVNLVILLLPVIAGKILGKKVAVHVRETLSHNKLFNIPYLLLIGKLADVIIGVSSASLKQFRKLGFKQKLKVVYNGIYSENNQETIKERRDLTIGTAAFFLPWKGIDIFIKSALELQKDNSDIDLRFEIAGDLPHYMPGNNKLKFQAYKDYLVNLKQSYDHSNWIKFLGFQSHIRKTMANWDVVVVPSTCWDSSPRVILEAFSSEPL